MGNDNDSSDEVLSGKQTATKTEGEQGMHEWMNERTKKRERRFSFTTLVIVIRTTCNNDKLD